MKKKSFSKVIGAKVDERLYNRIRDRGTVSDVVRLACEYYLEQDGMTAESLIMDSQRNLQRELENIYVHIRNQEALFSFYLRHFFTFAPLYPDDQTRAVAWNEGQRRYNDFKKKYRSYLESNGGSILFSLLTEMLEKGSGDEAFKDDYKYRAK